MSTHDNIIELEDALGQFKTRYDPTSGEVYEQLPNLDVVMQNAGIPPEQIDEVAANVLPVMLMAMYQAGVDPSQMQQGDYNPTEALVHVAKEQQFEKWLDAAVAYAFAQQDHSPGAAAARIAGASGPYAHTLRRDAGLTTKEGLVLGGIAGGAGLLALALLSGGGDNGTTSPGYDNSNDPAPIVETDTGGNKPKPGVPLPDAALPPVTTGGRGNRRGGPQGAGGPNPPGGDGGAGNGNGNGPGQEVGLEEKVALPDGVTLPEKLAAYEYKITVDGEEVVKYDANTIAKLLHAFPKETMFPGTPFANVSPYKNLITVMEHMEGWGNLDLLLDRLTSRYLPKEDQMLDANAQKLLKEHYEKFVNRLLAGVGSDYSGDKYLVADLVDIIQPTNFGEDGKPIKGEDGKIQATGGRYAVRLTPEESRVLIGENLDIMLNDLDGYQKMANTYAWAHPGNTPEEVAASLVAQMGSRGHDAAQRPQINGTVELPRGEDGSLLVGLDSAIVLGPNGAITIGEGEGAQSFTVQPGTDGGTASLGPVRDLSNLRDQFNGDATAYAEGQGKNRSSLTMEDGIQIAVGLANRTYENNELRIENQLDYMAETFRAGGFRVGILDAQTGANTVRVLSVYDPSNDTYRFVGLNGEISYQDMAQALEGAVTVGSSLVNVVNFAHIGGQKGANSWGQQGWTDEQSRARTSLVDELAGMPLPPQQQPSEEGEGLTEDVAPEMMFSGQTYSMTVTRDVTRNTEDGGTEIVTMPANNVTINFFLQTDSPGVLDRYLPMDEHGNVLDGLDYLRGLVPVNGAKRGTTSEGQYSEALGTERNVPVEGGGYRQQENTFSFFVAGQTGSEHNNNGDEWARFGQALTSLKRLDRSSAEYQDALDTVKQFTGTYIPGGTTHLNVDLTNR